MVRLIPNWLSHCLTCVWNVVLWLLNQVVPIVLAVWVEIRLGRGLSQQGGTITLTDEMDACLDLPIEEIKESHQLEIERLDQLRKTAQLNLGANALAVTIAFALVRHDEVTLSLNLFSASLAVFGVVSLIMSAVCALRANQVMPLHRMWLQLRTFPFGQHTPEWDEKAKLVKATFLTQDGNLIVSNYASASSVCMRNAVLAIGVLLISAIWSVANGEHQSSASPPKPVSPPFSTSKSDADAPFNYKLFPTPLGSEERSP